MYCIVIVFGVLYSIANSTQATCKSLTGKSGPLETLQDALWKTIFVHKSKSILIHFSILSISTACDEFRNTCD